VELVQRRASKDLVELCHCLLMAGMVGVQVLDPPARNRVARPRLSVGRVGQWAFDAHPLMVDPIVLSR
jgi:hypothetical protein